MKLQKKDFYCPSDGNDPLHTNKLFVTLRDCKIKDLYNPLYALYVTHLNTTISGYEMFVYYTGLPKTAVFIFTKINNVAFCHYRTDKS